KRGRAPPPVLLMVIVQQVLVVRISMYGFDMPFPDAEPVVHRFEHGCNRIGGAGCRRKYISAASAVCAVIDAGNDVWNSALRGGRKQYVTHAFRLQMPA